MRRIVLLCWIAWIGAGSGLAQSQGVQGKDGQQEDVRQLREQMRMVEDQMHSLQASLNSIEARLNAVEARVGEPAMKASGPAVAASAPAASGTPAAGKDIHKTPLPREVLSQALSAAPRIDNVPYGTEPGEIILPGTEISLRPGGYARVDAMYDFKPAGFLTAFIPSSIPIGPSVDTSGSRVDINQSHISVDLRRPTIFGSLRVFYANDFLGGTTTDPVYHLINLYGQLGNVLGGYTNSTFLDVDALPETLDNQGPNGSTTGSAAQIRYTHALGHGHSVAVSAEGAVVDIDPSNNPTDAQFTSQIPDIALRYRYDAEAGHLQVASIFRDIQGNVGNLIHPHVFGWGVTAAGAHSLFTHDTALFQGTYGSGIGHYLADLVGSGSDVAIDGNGDLVTLPAWGSFGGYQHHWSENLRSTATYGYTRINNVYGQSTNAFHSSQYAATNLIWSLSKTISMGGELLYGRHTAKNQSSADATRFQLTIQYDLFPSPR